jgi:hypothetical protein
MPRQLTDWLTAFIEYTSCNTEPPEMYRLWAGVSTIAAALQRKCKLEWGMLTFYPNLYIVLVGPSGIRKGTAMSPAQDMLDNLGIKMAAEAITREALIRELKNANSNESDITTGKMLFHSSLTIFSPELTVFLGYNNEQLMSDLTDWYDCRNKWTYRTKNMGTDEIVGVFVNLIGATTPDLIKATMSLKAIGGGLTSRIIFVYEQDEGKACPAPFLTDASIGLREQLQMDLEQIHMLSGRFQVTEGFLSMWTEWYVQQHSNPPFEDKLFSGYIKRRPNHVMKLSMVLNASRTDNMIIESTDLERAIKLLEKTERNMLNTFAGVGKYSHADTLTQVMNEIGMRDEEGISREELTFLFRNDANRMILREIIDTLNNMGWLDVITKDGEEFYKHRKQERR